MLSFGIDQLNYQAFFGELSQEPDYPYSLHLRNHLIAPYAALPCPPPASKQDSWKTYANYRRGAQLIVVGNVSASIIKEAGQCQVGKQCGPWGVAVLFPAYSYHSDAAESDHGDNQPAMEHVWHSMRLSLWLSSESSTTGPASLENVKVAEEQDTILLRSIFDDFLPRAVQKFITIRGEYSESISDHTVDLFAVNDAWVRVLDGRTKEKHSTIKLTRANPCMTFIKAEADMLSPFTVPSRWQVSAIHSKEEAGLVQKSNSISFPGWYINQRKHISVLIHDVEGMEGHAIQSSYYPANIQPGSPAAWAYAHDDLSLASLYVAEPYRRLKLGNYCVEIMAKRLIDAQKKALTQVGCKLSENPTPYFFDTEMHKGVSRLFFETLGFTGFIIATWGSISVHSNQDDYIGS